MTTKTPIKETPIVVFRIVSALRLGHCALGCCPIQFISTRLQARCVFSYIRSLCFLIPVVFPRFAFRFFPPFFQYYYYLCNGKCALCEHQMPTNTAAWATIKDGKVFSYNKSHWLPRCGAYNHDIVIAVSFCVRSSFFSVLLYVYLFFTAKRETFSVTENILLCHKTFPPTYTQDMATQEKLYTLASLFCLCSVFFSPVTGTRCRL